MYTVTLLVVGFLAALLGFGQHSVAWNIGIAAFDFLPIAAGIAILRYRLYDIDVVINRTLVYGVLTAALVLVYVGSIVLLQRLFHALTGETSQLAIVASTLAIAAVRAPAPEGTGVHRSPLLPAEVRCGRDPSSIQHQAARRCGP